MAKTNEPKVNVGTEPPVTRKRSQRKVGTARPKSSVNGVSKRKINVKGLPTVSIKNSPIDASNDKKDSKMARVKTVMGSPAKFILPPIDKIAESVQANKRSKRKIIAYEVDCTQINMDTATFRKDLWCRAKNGKINSIKNVRIKQTGKVIHITTRCYVPKKCIRSNIHFLIETYLKQKKIDHPVHIVGDKNVYKLTYK